MNADNSNLHSSAVRSIMRVSMNRSNFNNELIRTRTNLSSMSSCQFVPVRCLYYPFAVRFRCGLWTLILLLILGMLGTAAGESNVTLNIVPKHVEAGAGETFIISIDADPGGNIVSSVRFDLSYDTSLMEGVSIEKGRFLGQDGMQTAN